MHKVIIFAPEFPPLNFSELLGASGCEMLPTQSEADLLKSVDEFAPDCSVVLVTATMDPAVLRMIEQVRRIDHVCPTLILTSCVSAEDAICAMRAGASDLVARDAPAEKIIATLRSLAGRRLSPRIESADTDLIGGKELAGRGRGMRELRSQIARIAGADVSVLITGETGTGKELAAQLIHRNSRCCARPFVAINCAAVPEGLLESELFGHERGAFTGAHVARDGKLQQASGGTLFLDEIGDMALAAQAKILRAIESRVVQRLGSHVDRPVNVRLVAATNQDLETLIREKRFREDLYFRLNVVRLSLPPLRERLEDIPALIDHIVGELNQRYQGAVRRIEEDLVRRLQSYHWPGNVRELRNVLESILVFSTARSVCVADVPEAIRHTLRSSSAKYGDERTRIISALTSASWNRNRAAQILCCSRMTLYRKMARYSIAAA